MKLYHSGPSPFARKVLVLLHETGQTADVELNAIATTPLSPEATLSATNPLRKIPALERSDGVTLYDSRVITQFLDDRAGGGLYDTGARKWETLTLEATGDGIMDAGVAMSYEMRMRPEDKQWDGWLDAQWGKVASACKALNDRWMSHLHAPLDMGQISVACALSYLDFRHDARGWRTGCDALAAWHADFAARESMVQTAPD
jgi:glutathione S-transferase